MVATVAVAREAAASAGVVAVVVVMMVGWRSYRLRRPYTAHKSCSILGELRV